MTSAVEKEETPEPQTNPCWHIALHNANVCLHCSMDNARMSRKSNAWRVSGR